jgi:ABC-type nitrate/sulfonate/bicarbonate transport system permease component
MQTDLMFAALALVVAMALTLYFSVDRGLKKLVYWQQEEEQES